jgi:hypothetical protein
MLVLHVAFSGAGVAQTAAPKKELMKTFEFQGLTLTLFDEPRIMLEITVDRLQDAPGTESIRSGWSAESIRKDPDGFTAALREANKLLYIVTFLRLGKDQTQRAWRYPTSMPPDPPELTRNEVYWYARVFLNVTSHPRVIKNHRQYFDEKQVARSDIEDRQAGRPPRTTIPIKNLKYGMTELGGDIFGPSAVRLFRTDQELYLRRDQVAREALFRSTFSTDLRVHYTFDGFRRERPERWLPLDIYAHQFLKAMIQSPLPDGLE